MASVLRGVAVAVLFGAVVLAQGPSAPRVDTEFDAASIKPNNSGPGRTSISMPPIGIFRAENVTLRELIVDAYRVRRFQVEGGSDWLDGDRFDVTARTGDGAARERMHVMLQALLVDRFGLAFHRETRERPIYALAVARDDGVPKPALARSTSAEGSGMDTSGRNAFMMIRAKGQSMMQLAERLGNQTDRLIVDRTGLTGNYDFELQFTRDDAVGRSDQPAGATSLFTALREQLGLKLESARGPVEFLVIDKATRPTPD
jgi:uncharacterized protein (TIGR03435 family)